MTILVAPDKFKGSLTALQVCDAIEAGILHVFPDADVRKLPMADGGDGTVQALVDATGGVFYLEEVTGPLGDPVAARFGILGDGKTAVIEMASASGYDIVPEDKRNPLITTTYGTGQLIAGAIRRGATKLIIGIGGSATNDGGAGCAQAMGAKFLDESGNELPQGGAALQRLSRIDVSEFQIDPTQVEIVVACDVTNPLTGKDGASAVFGPQKGATEEMVRELDAALAHYAEVIRRDLNKDVETVPGAGAAGGLGAGLMAFLNAKLRRGIDIVMETVRFREQIQGVDLVITGEGGMDRQTTFWKAPMGVAQVAKESNIPVIAIVGQVGKDWKTVFDVGIDAVIPIVNRLELTMDMAKRDASETVADAAECAMRLVRIGRGTR